MASVETLLTQFFLLLSMVRNYKASSSDQDVKVGKLTESIKELKLIMGECQNPNGKLMMLLKKYKEVQEFLVNLTQEMQERLSNVPVEYAMTSPEENEKLQTLKQELITSTEAALRKIDSEEEKVVAQMKMKYLAMRLPNQSEDEGSSFE